MNENENFVVETENVEQTTEQTPKMFTQDEVNDIVGKAKARTRAKVEKEYDRRYSGLTDVLKAGTGKESVEEMTETFTKFYEGKGIKIRKNPEYSQKDIEVLARAEADEFIQAGYDDVVEEVNRLTDIGYENMTARDKAVFKVLAEHRQSAERSRELSKIGVGEDVYNSKEFTEFAKMFNSNTPITKIYEVFAERQPKKNIRTMGSMRNTSPDNGVKDYYSPEDIDKLTAADLRDPKVWEAVRRSMTGG